MGEIRNNNEPSFPREENSKRLLATIRDGGDGGRSSIYLPPVRRRMVEAQGAEAAEAEAENAYSVEAQKKIWEDERRVIHGIINRLNNKTIKPLLHDLFEKVNLIRMRGVLAKALLQATLVSAQKYGAVYAAALAVLHSKLPEVGDLVVQRTILHFRKSYHRKDKPGCLAMCLFLGHLFHQSVVHELLILQILSLLLQGDPTDDSVQMAIRLLQVTGHALKQESPAGVRAVLEQLRGLIHQGKLHPKIQQEAEGLLEENRKGFTPQLPSELDLVEQDDQICSEIFLDDENLDAEEGLNRFHPDDKYQQKNEEWKAIRAEVLGLNGSDDDDDDDDDGEDDAGSEAETDDDSVEDDDKHANAEEDANIHNNQDGTMVVASDRTTGLVVVKDMSEADLIHLRRTIYLTIVSSATFEECTHKLAKIDIPAGMEEELVNMLLECCAQERSFLRYYGLIGARFCFLADRWKKAFITAFAQQYDTIHRLETNKLRNVAKFLAHLLHTDAMPWSVMSSIHLNGEETTSSSRIFLKILFQEIAEAIGIEKLKARLEDPEHAEWFAQLLPRDGNLRNTRYAINFFTSIGLGPLTEGMRAYLKDAPKILAAQQEKMEAEHSDSDESSSMSSSSMSSSLSEGSHTSSSSRGSCSRPSSSSSSSCSSSSSSYSGQRRRRRRSPSHSSSTSSSSSSSYSSSSVTSSLLSSRGGARTSRGRRNRRGDNRSSEEDLSREVRRSVGKKERPRRSRSRSPENNRFASAQGENRISRSGEGKGKSSSDRRGRDGDDRSWSGDSSQNYKGNSSRTLDKVTRCRSRSRSSDSDSQDRRAKRRRRDPSGTLRGEANDEENRKEKRRRRNSSGTLRGEANDEENRKERSPSVDSFGRERRR